MMRQADRANGQGGRCGHHPSLLPRGVHTHDGQQGVAVLVEVDAGIA